eukprot:SAG11_NODE_17681_length_511_cov_1.497573_1_plen_41_part_10
MRRHWTDQVSAATEEQPLAVTTWCREGSVERNHGVAADVTL